MRNDPGCVLDAFSLSLSLSCRLIDILRDFGQGDWQLASLVCQTLWNFRSHTFYM